MNNIFKPDGTAPYVKPDHSRLIIRETMVNHFGRKRSARSRIFPEFPGRFRGVRMFFELGLRAETPVGMALSHQTESKLSVDVMALRLAIRPERPRYIGTFVPIDAKPA